MTSVTEQADREFVDAACLALRAPTDGGDPLDALGWWDLLSELSDRDARAAALALFRAQGRELFGSAALGGLMAQPFLVATGLPPGSLVATVSRWSPRRGERLVVVGDVAGAALLIDRPGHGAAVVASDQVELHPVAVAGRLAMYEVELGPCIWTATVAERTAEPARARGRFLGRLAMALEILGAAEGALALAVAHAATREQFGQPIGAFQAVRHLLAWARTDCVALEAVTTVAVRLDEATPPRHDEIVKALAGRNGRRVCERALQVLGAIGFTTEHDHHHFHSRVLALDALLGTSAELTHALGAWFRETGTDPAAPAAVLLSE
ncbi:MULTISPECIES: acyl-CoA dehydrogenase family protein [unclassified Pseudofrankia]|uniref:acyl-CoA dehydrogenase family protein n=1 Tax=unclassified Pseudofrankia TaxID=2994372 RepID=UPI0008D9FCE6|nr:MULTISPECIES: acyl-CoA dehydrogenase family protein [unclassified Pseudofrankia]MDT3443210.1 acyl-CoA dehydrogenase family protein [Pseudofrankia sp. BMG5.37]OHV58970.1 acyl-CoA dehydrogenase [Pseudofrankia sp. BMG5.36]